MRCQSKNLICEYPSPEGYRRKISCNKKKPAVVNTEENFFKAPNACRDLEKQKRTSSLNSHEIEEENNYNDLFGSNEAQIHYLSAPHAGYLKSASDREQSCLEDLVLLFTESFAVPPSKRIKQDVHSQESAESKSTSNEGVAKLPKIFLKNKRICTMIDVKVHIPDHNRLTEPESRRKEDMYLPHDHKIGYVEGIPDISGLKLICGRDLLLLNITDLEEDYCCS